MRAVSGMNVIQPRTFQAPAEREPCSLSTAYSCIIFFIVSGVRGVGSFSCMSGGPPASSTRSGSAFAVSGVMYARAISDWVAEAGSTAGIFIAQAYPAHQNGEALARIRIADPVAAGIVPPPTATGLPGKMGSL